MIDQNLNPINPTLSKRESHDSVSNQPLVEKMVKTIPSSVDCSFPILCEDHTAQVLSVSSNSSG